MFKKPFNYNNVAAKYFYVKSLEAQKWRTMIKNGILVPPPRNNPYITRADIEAYYHLQKLSKNRESKYK